MLSKAAHFMAGPSAHNVMSLTLQPMKQHALRAASASSVFADSRRSLHSSAPAQNSSVIIAGSFAMAFGAIGLRYVLVVSRPPHLWLRWRDTINAEFAGLRAVAR
jgi:hypothetical protein